MSATDMLLKPRALRKRWCNHFSLSAVCLELEEEIMDKDRVVGSAKEIKGAVKQAVGRAVGDAKLESEGSADKIEGKVQNAIGGIKDTLKGK
jgi:uncharacterized protein YjbJ (UPF0337 family)